MKWKKLAREPLVGEVRKEVTGGKRKEIVNTREDMAIDGIVESDIMKRVCNQEISAGEASLSCQDQ